MTPRDPEIPRLKEPTHEGFGPRGYPLTLPLRMPYGAVLRSSAEPGELPVDFDGFASADLDED